uniref:NAD-dependent epimerase/dehydratase domain-containing protein n=1 Tax=Ananas comosus var. bracteatus TaxID=296719 RepID=A0A6V7NM59_ANACO|nr:unnamed protein product [Ananas comosus var. bracteatus]
MVRTSLGRIVEIMQVSSTADGIIWTEENKVIFNGLNADPLMAVGRICALARQWEVVSDLVYSRIYESSLISIQSFASVRLDRMEKFSATKGKVCVTGAAGFVASWLIRRLLESGYYVTGTKLAHLWELKGARERLRLVKADLMEDGSFDNAVMGCEGVFHTASPLILGYGTTKHITRIFPVSLDVQIFSWQVEILDPAITGTLNLLRSCKKNPFLRRVVLTSSSSTVRTRDDIDPNLPLDETSWSSVELCERLQVIHNTIKTAELLFTTYSKEPFVVVCVGEDVSRESSVGICSENNMDLVTVLPSFVVGPSLPRQLCFTASHVLGLLKGEAERFSWYGRMGYVHIDDVARCHILVYETGSARGRYLCSSTVLDNHELAALLAKRYPFFPIPARFEAHYGKQDYKFDTSKLQDMGFKFKGIEEMFDDCIQSLYTQGHLP